MKKFIVRLMIICDVILALAGFVLSAIVITKCVQNKPVNPVMAGIAVIGLLSFVLDSYAFLRRRGIYRRIPVQSSYDDESDEEDEDEYDDED
jgi:uncharacterized protein with PQ loop repeat